MPLSFRRIYESFQREASIGRGFPRPGNPTCEIGEAGAALLRLQLAESGQVARIYSAGCWMLTFRLRRWHARNKGTIDRTEGAARMSSEHRHQLRRPSPLPFAPDLSRREGHRNRSMELSYCSDKAKWI